MNHKRIMSLDFLRALAILSVFVSHSILAYGPTLNTAFLQFGASGVDLFFVLSGWLLGNVIFKELQTSGSLDIKRFWIRRWMRTLPAYFAVLLALISLQIIKNDNYDIPLAYFFFLQNYFLEDFFYISWSLAVEEQFYLFIAPFLLFIFLRCSNKIVVILVVLLFLPIILRLLGWYTDIKQTHVRIDGCIMGVLLAYFYRFHHARFVAISYLYRWWFAAFGIGLYLGLYVYKFIGFPNVDKLIHVAIFACLLIFATTCSNKQNLMTKFSYYFATRSYSIYLLHPIPLATMNYIKGDSNVLVFTAVSLAITCVLSELLYRLVEVKFMNMREVFRLSQSRFTY
jgi:peptidoglycan/LPS O-acetylase OafA/YrhL